MEVFISKLIVDSSGYVWWKVDPKKRIVDNTFIIKMFAYSAKKNKAKGPPAYSTLNPDTSSDSPSVKSNGVRLVSAKEEINHMVANGHAGAKNHMCSCVMLKLSIIKLPVIRTKHSKIRPKETS